MHIQYSFSSIAETRLLEEEESHDIEREQGCEITPKGRAAVLV